MGWLDESLASSAVIYLAVFGGMILSEAIPEIPELRLDRDGFVVRRAWGRRRYRWRDIPVRFQVVPGERGRAYRSSGARDRADFESFSSRQAWGCRRAESRP
jgi:hypothetical protein